MEKISFLPCFCRALCFLLGIWWYSKAKSGQSVYLCCVSRGVCSLCKFGKVQIFAWMTIHACVNMHLKGSVSTRHSTSYACAQKNCGISKKKMGWRLELTISSISSSLMSSSISRFYQFTFMSSLTELYTSTQPLCLVIIWMVLRGQLCEGTAL